MMSKILFWILVDMGMSFPVIVQIPTLNLHYALCINFLSTSPQHNNTQQAPQK